MRLTSCILSFLVHLIIVALGLYFPLWGQNVRVDLDRPVYEVELVRMPKKKTVPKPKQEIARKTSPPKESTQTKSSPKAVKVASNRHQPPPKPKHVQIPQKPSPKSAKQMQDEKKPQLKENREDKPKKPSSLPTKKNILSQALNEVQKDIDQNVQSDDQVLSQELAMLRNEINEAGGSAAADSGRISRVGEVYGRIVEQRIKKNWRYPRLERNLNLQAEVRVSINSQGEVTGVELTKRSGRSDFDSSVLRAVEETKILPPPPNSELQTIDITFNLQERMG